MGRGSPRWKGSVEVCWRLPGGLDEVRDEDWQTLPFLSLDDGPELGVECVAFPVS